MPLRNRLLLGWKAWRELGPRQVIPYAWYQLSLRSGWMRRVTPVGGQETGPLLAWQPLFSLPQPENLAAVLGEPGRAALLQAADEVVAGRTRLFGGEPVPLHLSPPLPLRHWTDYDSWAPAEDPKFTWEPARFGWAFQLGRAYLLAGDERYPQAFWRFTEEFLAANPPNQGPHWVSAQEVGLRLMAWAFAIPVFSPSPYSTPERVSRLVGAVAAHARRIPPSLAYARSQHNNHLLTETAALYTAGRLLPAHPEARRWRDLGWQWFHQGLQAQIAPGGAYSQHSANYHRLMLHCALWVRAVAGDVDPFPAASLEKLAAATLWLLALLDPFSGGAPNLGPNDGAYILPLDVGEIGDYRPALQAAGAAFLGRRPFPSGIWDEPLEWLGGEGKGEKGGGYKGKKAAPGETTNPSSSPLSSPLILSSPDRTTWAYLRAARFNSRPGHADQLHLDLWWQGLNVARDPGTYRYTAPPPWDNALAGAAVHNTLTLEGQDPMTRAGRFLYLDWDQAEVLHHSQAPDSGSETAAALHQGYRRLGVVHRRNVDRRGEGSWQVHDQVLPLRESLAPLTARVHWLLPDWPWELEGAILHVRSPYGWVKLEMSCSLPASQPADKSVWAASLARAGESLAGEEPVEPTEGWASPAYGVKTPALSFSVRLIAAPPFAIHSAWLFPEA